jgi:hypothetical protein
MPILNDKRRLMLGFGVGRQSGMRATGETLEQFQDQLRRKKEQRSFDHRYYKNKLRSCRGNWLRRAMKSRNAIEKRHLLKRRAPVQ